MSRLDDAAWKAYLALADGLRHGPKVTEDMRSDLAGISGYASVAGFKSLALALLLASQAIEPTMTAEVLGNTIADVAEFVTDPGERRLIQWAARVLRGDRLHEIERTACPVCDSDSHHHAVSART